MSGKAGIMEVETYFFDTYAFFELIKGSSNYRKYSSSVAIMTTKLNLMELYYGLLIRHGKETAEKYYEALSPFAINISDITIKNAMEFKSKNKGSRMSYIDCLGYVLGLENNIKFLTGDRQFEKLPNVEFVK